MTLQQLQYIVALDTYRHYVTASEKCFVTQPTITTQVKKLEDEIGVVIFDRSKTPLKPTKAGKLIIAKARNIMGEVSQLKEMVSTVKESIDGEFQIGIIPTLSAYIVPKFAGSFSKKYPKTILNIEEMKTESIIDSLEKGKIDIGILVTPIDEPFIREINLYNEPFVFYGHKDHPLQQKELVKAEDVEQLNDMWLLNSGHCFREQMLNICNPSSRNSSINFQSGSIESLKKMVDNYGGFTLIPEMAVNEQDMGRIVHFAEPKPIREVSIVVHNSFAKEGLVDALRKEVLSIVPANFSKNQRFMKVKWR